MKSFVLAVLLLSMTLRSPIVAMGPILKEVERATGSSAAAMGLIGTLPALAFALCSPFAAKLAKHFGIRRIILGGLIVTGLGCWLRSATTEIRWVMAGTFVLCAGIAMGNVLLSGAIRQHQPQRIAKMTALQTVAFGISSAAASASMVPLAQLWGWQWALGIWGLLVVPAWVAWWFLPDKPVPKESIQRTGNVWKSALAWKLGIFMGVQSGLYFSFTNWLPTMIASRGLSAQAAGLYNTVFQFMALPTMLLVMVLVERYEKTEYLTASSGASVFLGFVGLWFCPTSYLIVPVAFLSLGSAACFALCLMLFALRGKTPAQAASMSGMAQTVGYLIAIWGPISIGWLLAWSGSWRLPAEVIAAACASLIVLGWMAGKPAEL